MAKKKDTNKGKSEEVEVNLDADGWDDDASVLSGPHTSEKDTDKENSSQTLATMVEDNFLIPSIALATLVVTPNMDLSDEEDPAVKAVKLALKKHAELAELAQKSPTAHNLYEYRRFLERVEAHVPDMLASELEKHREDHGQMHTPNLLLPEKKREKNKSVPQPHISEVLLPRIIEGLLSDDPNANTQARWLQNAVIKVQSNKIYSKKSRDAADMLIKFDRDWDTIEAVSQFKKLQTAVAETRDQLAEMDGVKQGLHDSRKENRKKRPLTGFLGSWHPYIYIEDEVALHHAHQELEQKLGTRSLFVVEGMGDEARETLRPRRGTLVEKLQIFASANHTLDEARKYQIPGVDELQKELTDIIPELRKTVEKMEELEPPGRFRGLVRHLEVKAEKDHAKKIAQDKGNDGIER